MTTTPTFILPSGAKIPALAYGTGTLWFKAPSDEPSVDRETVDAIKGAIELGYRHLDGAEMYNTEHELGLAIKESGVPRSDLFVTTKANGLDNIERRLEKSLKRMGLEYVDLYLIHSPFAASSPEDLQCAWEAMEQCLKRGLTKHIGVSNFAITHLETILAKATIKPAVNQIEMHPYIQQAELHSFMADNGILGTGFAPLTPLRVEAAGTVMTAAQRLGKKYGVSEGSVLLQWVIGRGCAVVTTSGKKERLQRLLAEVSSFVLTKGEIEEIGQAAGAKRVRSFFEDEFSMLERS